MALPGQHQTELDGGDKNLGSRSLRDAAQSGLAGQTVGLKRRTSLSSSRSAEVSPRLGSAITMSVVTLRTSSLRTRTVSTRQ
jgi:hypothetical protein